MNFYGASGTWRLADVEFRPGRGFLKRFAYTGVPSAIASLYEQAVADGLSAVIDYDAQGGYAGLHVDVWTATNTDTNEPTTEDEPLSDVFELVGNDLEKSIWEHPKTLAEFEAWPLGLQDPSIGPFKGTVERYVRGEIESLEDELATLVNALNRPQILDLAYELAGLLGAGTEAWNVSQYVLRRTRELTLKGRDALPSASYLNQVNTGIGKVWSIAAMVDAEDVPAPVAALLPPEGVWLKRTPTFTGSGSRWTLQQEYWHADKYSTFLYEEEA